MRNFQGMVFKWIRTYREIFQICISVPLSKIVSYETGVNLEYFLRTLFVEFYGFVIT